MRNATTCLLLVVLCGCSTTHAPVSSRGVTPEPRPTVSGPGTAVTRPAQPVSRSHAGNDGLYVVRRGDTLYSVAWQHGLAVTDVVQQNGIQSPYTIYPGQRLRINPPSAARAPVRSQPLSPARTPQATPVRPATQPAAQPAAKPVPNPAPNTAARPASKPVEKKAATGAATPAYDGTWRWPTRGRVLRGFQPGSTGKKGIDIGGHHAQPVKAAASGKVVYAGSGLVGYGRLIIVKHNDTLLSAYGHNSKLLVTAGDFVKTGDTIARMGNSGTNRTALYFEIRKDGKPVNPMKYLPRN